MKRREWQGAAQQAPVVGITGTGGAGKSSVTDELLNRFGQCYPRNEDCRACGGPPPAGAPEVHCWATASA